MSSGVPPGVAAAVERVLGALPRDAARRERRFVLGIAGPPAAGKSTLAAALRDALNGGRRCVEPRSRRARGGIPPGTGIHATSPPRTAGSRRAREVIPAGTAEEPAAVAAAHDPHPCESPPLDGTPANGAAAPGPAGEVAAIAALDGFHYDDRVLHARGHRPRKGAPFTFDVEGYVATLDRLRAPGPIPDAVAVPVFDRDLEIARAAAEIVEPHHRIVITEGNYLLLDDERWRPVRGRLDLSVFIDVPEEELRRRLMERWFGHGYGAAEAKEKTEANDLLNARAVTGASVEPDLRMGAAV